MFWLTLKALLEWVLVSPFLTHPSSIHLITPHRILLKSSGAVVLGAKMGGTEDAGGLDAIAGPGN